MYSNMCVVIYYLYNYIIISYVEYAFNLIISEIIYNNL